jgi:hypothetical protein
MPSKSFGARPCARSWMLAALVLLSLPFALAAQPLQVTGRAVDDQDQGLAGARVELLPAQEGYADAVRRLKKEPGPAPLATAVTDTEGRFRIAAPGPGCFRLVVRADGHLSMEYPLAPLVEDRELPAVLLQERASLEIRIVGADGRPLPGISARLEAEEYPGLATEGEALASWQLARWDGTSGPEGKLALPRELGERSRLAILDPRFLGQGMGVQGYETGPVLRLVPGPATRIEVLDAAGHPVPGALIRWKGEPVAVTGPRGRAEIASPEGDTLTVEGPAGQQAKLSSRLDKGILTVRLEPPHPVTGRIVDEAGGKPVPRAVLWSGWPPATSPVLSATDGSFQLDLPPGGEGGIESAAAGFLPGARRFVKKGQTGPLLLKLSPAAAIAGLVVDSAGRPVAGAEIELDGRTDPFGEEPLRTGPDGRFRLPGLRPGSAYKVTVKHEGFAPARETVRTAPAGRAASPARIVLKDGATVAGWLAGEDGRPVDGADLALVSPADRFGRSAAHARSDAEGKFAFRHLLPGAFDLIALHPRHAKLRMEGIEVSPGAGPVDLGRLTMPDGTTIEGLVVDGHGAPVVGAEIMPMPTQEEDMDLMAFRNREGQGQEPVRTGPDGRFRLEGLRAGSRYELVAVHPEYGMASAPGVKAPTEEPVRIEMKKMRIFSGRVVGPEGEPVAGAELSWVQESRIGGGASFSASGAGFTDAEGRFQVPELSPGLGDLVARAPGYMEGRLPRTRLATESDVSDLKIVLDRGSVLEVRVLGSEGEPISGVWVNVSPQSPTGGLQPFSAFGTSPKPTDAEGRWRTSVAPGNYEVSALVKGRALRGRAAVGAGTTAVELRMPSGAEISGRVVLEDGAGAPEAVVSLTDPSGFTTGIPTEPDGGFLFAGVADGSYRLAAQEMAGGTPGVSSDPLEISVKGQSIRGLELRLTRHPEGVRLTGRLLRFPPDEIPLVRLLASGPGVRKGEVDPSGTYLVKGLPPGTWTVQAILPSGRETHATVEVRPGDTELTRDLDLSPGVTISGRILVDGVPLAGATVQSLGVDQEGRQDRTAYDGSFALQGVGYGPVTLLVGTSGGIGASRRLMIREKQEIEIAIATGRLLGKVVSATGEPLENANLDVEGWVEDLQVPFATVGAQSGESGLFELPRLGAGLYRIVATKPGFAPVEVRVEVRPGRDNTVEVRLPPRE